MGVPYCIVKGKARLGLLVRRKTCSSVAITQVKIAIILLTQNYYSDNHFYFRLILVIRQI